jgi:hypothetical protein
MEDAPILSVVCLVTPLYFQVTQPVMSSILLWESMWAVMVTFTVPQGAMAGTTQLEALL